MKKYVLGIVALVVIAGGAYWYMQQSTPVVFSKEDFTWKFEDLGVTEYSQPQNQVSLVVGGALNKTFVVGTYQLGCSEGRIVVVDDPSEIAVASCWWGGGGKEIGVFKENSVYVVKEGDIDEGSAENNGFRGNFKTLFEVK